jgi:hypothetical protein
MKQKRLIPITVTIRTICEKGADFGLPLPNKKGEGKENAYNQSK